MAVKYEEPIIIHSFRDPENPDKIHPELLRFKRVVSRIAVRDFSNIQLKAYYEANFYKAFITYVKSGNEVVAFFIAVFKKETDNNNQSYFTASGFPGIKLKNRKATADKTGSTEGKANNVIEFKKILKNLIGLYIQFYLEQILVPNRIQPAIQITNELHNAIRNRKIFTLHLIIKLLMSISNLRRDDRLILHSYAENPVMYASLVSKGLKFTGNDPRPASSDLNKIQNWDTRTLLLESYKQSLNNNQHPCLVKPKFVVDIFASEWRDFFEKACKNNDQKSAYFKYFLWQNYHFPNNAFEMKLVIDFKNILAALF